VPGDVASRASTRSYLICTVQRAGSNLLCQRLRRTGLAGAPYEVFAPVPLATHSELWDVSSFSEYLEQFRKKTASPNGAVGAKVMWDQLEPGVRMLRDEAGYRGVRDDDVLEAAFPGARYVWLRRDDKVRQGLSSWRAECTQKWDVRHDTPIARAPAYDLEAIDGFVRRAIEHDAEWAKWFTTRGIKPYVVTYESFTRQPERTLRDILGFLGIDTPFDFGLRRDRWTWRARSQVQADGTTDEFEARYRADKAAHGRA
jgi:trehalose 2-sulfotransferase